jgi:DNA polymerase-2
VDTYVRKIASDLLQGKFDTDLLYNKRLRRNVDEYIKNVPPHVQAARQLERPGRRITYAITVDGPQPAQKRVSGFDYAHYLDRQLAPAADGILQFLGTSFEAITADQLEMF